MDKGLKNIYDPENEMLRENEFFRRRGPLTHDQGSAIEIESQLIAQKRTRSLQYNLTCKAGQWAH